jgi:hypothetical protein
VIRAMVSVVLLSALSLTASFAAEGTDPAGLHCNQLGREIALQAAEQLSVPLDADSRTKLAGIAEQACLDYARPAQPAVTEAAPAAAVVPDKNNEFFDLELIDPADRVRRPGLKRR